jgi:hypothetical protein
LTITPREGIAIVFIAAAFTHMSENPSLYLVEWSAGGHTNKPAILSLAAKVCSSKDDEHP